MMTTIDEGWLQQTSPILRLAFAIPSLACGGSATQANKLGLEPILSTFSHLLLLLCNALVFLDSQTESCFTFPIQVFLLNLFPQFTSFMHFVLYDLCVKFECALCTRPSQAEGAEQLGFSNEGKAAPSDTPAPLCFSQKPEHWFSFGSMTFSWDSLLICQQLLLIAV